MAGDGNQGFSGDGGAATDAAVQTPSEIFLDSSGNLYVAESG